MTCVINYTILAYVATNVVIITYQIDLNGYVLVPIEEMEIIFEFKNTTSYLTEFGLFGNLHWQHVSCYIC